jgi:FAD:protein FMN transferase
MRLLSWLAALRRVGRGGEGRRGRSRTGNFESVLGTSLEIQVVAGTRRQAARAEVAALAEIRRLEGTFSVFRPDSELRRWCAAPGEEVAISSELARVLDAAAGWRSRTGGAFDPAAERGGHRAAGPEAATRESGPSWEVRRDPAGRAMARLLSPVALNLNAIAKGFIVDRAAEAAWAVPGVREVMVNVGGDIRHIGEGPVTVFIADPYSDADNAPPIGAVRIRGQGVATSGSSRRGVVVDGRLRSHISDPRDGRPVENVVGASVIAATAMDADALATALSVLGPEEGLRLVESSPGVACLIATRDGRLISSEGWRRHLLAAPP